jgi:hypothetical protein
MRLQKYNTQCIFGGKSRVGILFLFFPRLSLLYTLKYLKILVIKNKNDPNLKKF